MKNVVVVGASLAGWSAARALRAQGFDGELTIVGNETRRPYDRPPLSKDFLAGIVSEDSLALESDAEDLNARWLLGVRATQLDVAMGAIRLDNGTAVYADGVVVATGARARPWPGTQHLAGVHVLRTIDDALALRAALRPGVRLLVIGAGFIGGEVASTATKLGLDVTVIEAARAPLAGPLGVRLGAAIARLHAEHGTRLLCGVPATGLIGNERVSAVRLADGRVLPADVVVVGIGTKPNIEWLQGSPVSLADGVVCNGWGALRSQTWSQWVTAQRGMRPARVRRTVSNTGRTRWSGPRSRWPPYSLGDVRSARRRSLRIFGLSSTTVTSSSRGARAPPITSPSRSAASAMPAFWRYTADAVGRSLCSVSTSRSFSPDGGANFRASRSRPEVVPPSTKEIAVTTASLPNSLVSTLPGNHYTDSALFTIEQANIFESMWFCAVRSSDLGTPGAFRTVQIGRESIMITRSRGGEVRAFFNVCRHRGAQLCTEESGQAERAFQCPYHAWTYDFDGKLIAAPNLTKMPDVDRIVYGLRRIEVREWLGYVWVCLAENPPSFEGTVQQDVGDRLGDVALINHYDIARLSVGRRIRYDVKANWKLVIENFLECYHCATIHPELTEVLPEFAEGLAVQYRVGHGAAFATDVQGFTIDGSPGVDQIPSVTADQDRRYFAITIKPQVFVNLVPDHVIVHRLFPLAVDQTVVECDWLYMPDVIDSGQDISRSVELFHRVNEQDFTACERCQPTMASCVYRDGGVLVPSEHHIGEFHNWLLVKLAG